MVNARTFLSALLSFSFIGHCIAGFNGTHVTYVPKVYDWENGDGQTTVHAHSIHPDYIHLYENDNSTLHSRGNTISVAASVVTATGSIIANTNAAAQFWKYLQEQIEYQNRNEVCTMTFGTWSGEDREMGYAWKATAKGSTCTVSGLKDFIWDELWICGMRLHKQGATTGCCRFTQESTGWTGELRLSAEPVLSPAKDIDCD